MSEQEKATFREFIGLLMDDKDFLDSMWRAKPGGEQAVRDVVENRNITLTDEDYTALLSGLPANPPDRPQPTRPILDTIHQARGQITTQSSWRW